jgi:hypothetical protein
MIKLFIRNYRRHVRALPRRRNDFARAAELFGARVLKSGINASRFYA